MQRILLGTITCSHTENRDTLFQEIADSTIAGYTILQVLASDKGQIAITVDRPATDRLVGRYEIEPKVWLHVRSVGRPLAITSDTSWQSYVRQTPPPNHQASRLP